MSRPGRLPFGLFEEGMVVARLAPQGIRLFAGTTSMGIFRTICRRLEQHSGDDGCGAVHVFHIREPLRKELQTNLAAKCGQAGLACRRRAFQVLKGLVGCGANEKKNMADRNSDSLAAVFLRQACRPREEEFPKGCGRRMPVRRPPDAAQPIRRIMAPPMTSRMASTRTTESFSPKNNTAMIMPKMTDVSRRAATRAMGATVMAQMAMP